MCKLLWSQWLLHGLTSAKKTTGPGWILMLLDLVYPLWSAQIVIVDHAHDLIMLFCILIGKTSENKSITGIAA